MEEPPQPEYSYYSPSARAHNRKNIYKMAESQEYADLDFDNLDEVREDMERVLDEGSEFEGQLKGIRSFKNEWTNRDGEEQTTLGVEWSFNVVNAAEARDNGFRVNQRTVWGSFAFKRTLIAVATVCDKTEGIHLNLEAAMENEDSFLNGLVEDAPTIKFIAGVEKWKDKDSGDERKRTRIGKFLD